jgi:DNA-binding response OmpR family regulator
VIVLLVDDEQRLLDALQSAFAFHWPETEVLTATDGDTALHLFFASEPDVVVLDVRLPDCSGFDVLSEIRRSSDVPVLLLTAARDEMDHVRGLRLGGDAYLTKPIGALALLAHVDAILRRWRPTTRSVDLVVGGLRLRSERREVVAGERIISLTPIEYRLLQQLMSNAGHVLTRSVLIRRVWKADEGATNHDLRVFIARLRAKIQPPGCPRYIETERDVGYRLIAPVDTL